MKNFDQLDSQKESFKYSLLKKECFSGPFSGQFCSNFRTSKKSLSIFSFWPSGTAKKFATVVQSTEQKNEISSFHQISKYKTNQIKKKLLNGYSKIHELKLVTIDLASPEKIQSWAEKELPNGKIFGEVTNANTFQYRTFKPSKGGLFCERIFGPMKDFECACGKRQRPTALESRKILEHEQTTRSFCPNCDVEYTWSILRRYQLGYIKLNAPVAHLWYFKTNPSYLSILFDMKRKNLESIIYCTETITIENTWKYSTQNSSFSRSPKDLYLTWQKLLKNEEKFQKYQRMFENKQEKQKQKKNVFRNVFLKVEKISPQLNWQNIEKTSFAFGCFWLETNGPIDQPKAKGQQEKMCSNGTLLSKNETKTKSEILLNISKQKQKKLVFFLFEEIWKNFLKKTYKNALFLKSSQQFQSTSFFQNMNTVFNMFLFSSKKNTKFSSFSDICFDLNVFDKEWSVEANAFQNTQPNQTDFDISAFGWQPTDEPTKQNKKKKYWKSLFFLFEFTSFFVDKKNKKQKNLHSISKKNFLFLMNLLPFLKQILLFKDLKFQKKNSQKMHEFVLKNIFLNKENKEVNENSSFFSSILPYKDVNAIFAFGQKANSTKQKVFKKVLNSSPINLLLQENFAFGWQTTGEEPKQCIDSLFTLKRNSPHSENKISSFLELNVSSLDLKNKNNSFPFILNPSMNFHKLFTFLKSYYEVDFCFALQSNSFMTGQDQKNFFESSYKEEVAFGQQAFGRQAKFLERKVEEFFNHSQVYSMYEKLFFNCFSFFLYVFQENRISIFNNSFQNFSELFGTAHNRKYFYSRNFRIEEYLFFSLKYTASFFLFFSKSEFQHKKTENKYSESIQEKKMFFIESQDQENKQKKNRIFISNKPFVSRKEFNKKKKEIQNEQIQKFFHTDSIYDSGNNFLSKSQNKNSMVVPSDYIQTLTKKKSFLRSKKAVFAQKGQKNNIFIFKSQKEQKQLNENNSFLKNRISTLAYNSPWGNDADWKYFVYYNSFFLYEFDDNPIFIYRALFPFKSALGWSVGDQPKATGHQAKNNQVFSTSEKNSIFQKTQQRNVVEPYSSFLSLCIDSFPKNFFVGAGIIEKLLSEYTSLELRKMTKQHQILLPKINAVLRFLKQNSTTKKDSLKIQKYFQKREHIIRRLKFLRKFSRRNSNPTFMILKNLPVLPPDLRPILKLQNQIAASDLNRFYQRIIYRNDRLKKFSKDSATNASFEMKYAQRLLQEAVDNLIQNGKGSVKAETNSRGQPLKSLSEILKGKQGRFRQYLLGKRVDYSGRSVIVVGPELKLYECGLPREMALELFLPFLIQYVLHNQLAKTVIGAKNLLKADSNLTLHLLHKVMKNIPVLLNRAPTLHRLGFQAFIPKLIEGRAILLHPMVCPAFNADFDGDQMAVHIPLTVEARTEAWKFMLSTNNLMNSATGEAIVLPSQDMVLGCYYLTLDFKSKFVGVQLSNSLKKKNLPVIQRQKFMVQNKAFLFFKNLASVLTAYQKGEISLHTPVWVNWNAAVDFGNEFSKPLEIRLQTNGFWQQIQPKYTTLYNNANTELYKTIRTTPGRILMNFMIQECSLKKF